jgi:hypothetical protein
MAGKLGTRGVLGMLAYDGKGTHGVAEARAGLLWNYCKLLAKDDCPSSVAKLTSARGHGGRGPTFA